MADIEQYAREILKHLIVCQESINHFWKESKEFGWSNFKRHAVMREVSFKFMNDYIQSLPADISQDDKNELWTHLKWDAEGMIVELRILKSAYGIKPEELAEIRRKLPELDEANLLEDERD